MAKTSGLKPAPKSLGTMRAAKGKLLKASRHAATGATTKPAKKQAKPKPASTTRHRDDFSVAVLRLIANEVGNLCSNPGCGAPTSGPSRSRGASNIGTGAHITAAAAGGPRYDVSLSTAERKAAANAIWLCARCGRLVDNDESTYTVDDLQDWKAQAIARAHRALETGKVPQPGPSENSIVHDKDVFVRSDAIMGERPLRDHVDLVLTAAAMDLDADQFVRDWERFFELESNQYLIPALRFSCQEARTAMRVFGNFVTMNFFVRGSRPRIYLHPHLNIDLDGSGADEDVAAYDRHVTEMVQLGTMVLSRYTAYRRTVKEHLFL
jgi:hypothetical protein